MKLPPNKVIFEWDVVNWSKALPLWEKELIQGGGTALTLAEGKGGLSLLPLMYGYKLTSTDLNGVSEIASNLYSHYGYTDIHYAPADVLNLPFPDEQFDVVFFKSMLGACRTKENQQIAFREIHRVLKQGGKLCFSENLVASPVHTMLRKRANFWNSYWRYVSIQEVTEYSSHFSSFQYITAGVLGALGRNNFQRNILGSLDTVIEKIIPSSFHYVLHGVCTK